MFQLALRKNKTIFQKYKEIIFLDRFINSSLPVPDDIETLYY